jgi:DnaJ-class molecular chaperone
MFGILFIVTQPDNPEAAERFKEIGMAYETLNDPKKKEIYDKFITVDVFYDDFRYGEEGLKENEEGEGAHFTDATSLFEMLFGLNFGEERGRAKRKVYCSFI